MDKKYVHIGSPFIKAIEECNELIHIICKAERFGMNTYHPDDLKKASNKAKMISEIADVRYALEVLEQELNKV